MNRFLKNKLRNLGSAGTSYFQKKYAEITEPVKATISPKTP